MQDRTASIEPGNGVELSSNKPTLLVVEDDPGLQTQLKWCFEGYEVVLAGDRPAAMAALRRYEPPVVLQDLGLPPDPEGVSEGFATLQEIIRLAPRTKVIVVTGQLDRENAVKAVGQGAVDFYQKPVDTDVLRLIVDRQFYIHGLESMNLALQRAQGPEPLAGVIATSDAMTRVCRTIEKVAPTMATTLLLGESGTGKELLARAVHALSPRAEKNFVAINCAAIPDTLLESELFGHEKGAFTGAVKQTQGKFEVANGGTLFLDEIGDMPLPLQAKLLRFLQDRCLERIGGRERIPVDVRIVCATNKDLQAMIGRNEFREDLFYRISEVSVRIPPLRDRIGDVPVIAQSILERRAREHGRTLKGFTPEALRALQAYPWPGNIRELENRISGAVIMAEAKYLTVEDLGLPADTAGLKWLNLREVRHRAESEAVRQALAITQGNVSRTSELLGITRPTLYDLMGKLGIRVAEDEAPGPAPATRSTSASG
ncbi:MAG TPA: PEP-CTERM-box response regulator transcription factor [Steroidobacteraceae bacterium]|nr:PEP-CTERM-box response regulator transcription factor [Steroidobacteraceae bacterium]